ncbi:hypothetical protein [Streptomyces sp. NPDC004270]
MRYEETAKLTTARALVPVAIFVTSPVLLIAGAPVRRRYLRYVYRDEAPLILEHAEVRRRDQCLLSALSWVSARLRNRTELYRVGSWLVRTGMDAADFWVRLVGPDGVRRDGPLSVMWPVRFVAGRPSRSFPTCRGWRNRVIEKGLRTRVAVG